MIYMKIYDALDGELLFCVLECILCECITDNMKTYGVLDDILCDYL